MLKVALFHVIRKYDTRKTDHFFRLVLQDFAEETEKLLLKENGSDDSEEKYLVGIGSPQEINAMEKNYRVVWGIHTE